MSRQLLVVGVRRDGSVRGFTLGVLALREDLAVEPVPSGVGSASDLVRAARLKQTLAGGQARAGDLEQACLGAEGVARIYRRLAEREPDRYRPELALTLTAWGLWASRLGHRERSEELLAEAVTLHRGLLERTGRHRVMSRIRLLTGLAVALTNLGAVRSELDRHAPATDAAEEALAVLDRLRERHPLYRMLARSNPVGFRHCHAAALNNLGLVLAARGHRRRARELAEQTVVAYRELARLAPVVFEAELARALHNLGLAAAEVGRLEQALDATGESVRLHRTLAAYEPGDGHPDLARALCAFARVRAGRTGEGPGALAAAGEAVRLLEALTADRPELYSPDLHVAYQTVTLLRAIGAAGEPGRGRGGG